MRLTCLVPLVVTLAAGIGVSAAQRGRGVPPPTQPPPERPVFRQDVDAVLVDLRVVDGVGRFVPDLEQEDFRIFEDDVEQDIRTFGLIQIPIEPPPPLTRREVAPDVATNIGTAEGRLYALVLDDAVGQVNSHRSTTVRELAREFIERNMGEHDRAAVMPTTGRAVVSQDFTNDRTRLVRAVDSFEAGYGQEAVRLTRGGLVVADPCGQLRSKVKGLEVLADWLAQINGRRKAIVFFTERMGSDAPAFSDNFFDAIDDLECEGTELRALVTAASRGNVAIYVIDPVGLPGSPASGVKPVYVDDSFGPLGAPNALGSEFNMSRRQGLTVVAEATGGFALVSSNEFTRAFARVVEDNSSYYLLGYVSTNPKKDGKFRRIRVEVQRRGLQVRARTGYVSAERQLANRYYQRGVSQALNETLQSPVSIPGLAIGMSAIPIKGTGSKAIVPVLVGIEDPPDGRRVPRRPIDLLLAAAEQGGGTKDMRRISMQNQRLIARLELNPGRYHLRAAGADATGDLLGSVVHDIDVPDFSKEPLTMSGLAIGSEAESKGTVRGFTDEWRRLLRVAPTWRRTFPPSDALLVAAEIYDNENKAAHGLGFVVSVRDSNGNVVHRQTQDVAREPSRDKTATFARTWRIPLARLEPGEYVLSVEAQNPAKANARAIRQVPFAVAR